VSQVAAKKKLVLQDERVKVTAFFLEQGSVLQGTAEGRCESFAVEMAIESGESPDKIHELIRLARRMCFTEDALTGNVPLAVQYSLNGQPIEV
jgi:organic hydroperoxide reductase OsmC/OhrA